ncbi:Gfo/Idh/MocA family protein [Roseomonas sp. BN140053]|uniref:Gfo/Idh/MocA family protein n=1 Tax=Roseomonas sp. BN140053 TaxID=3391898 RepID=UPI0039EAE4BB
MSDQLSPERLRVGVVGAGIIAGVHLGNLGRMPDVELVGVADPALDRARAAAEPRGARAFADAEELLDAAAPDALILCLPAFARGDIVAQAAARGVHLFIEKPAALTLAEARRTAAMVDGTGVVAAVGFMWRWTPAARALRGALKGEPHALLGRLLNGPPGPAWSFDAALSGGLLVEFGSHLLDAMRAVGGEVVRVRGSGASLDPDPGGRRGPDTALLELEFGSGAMGSAQVSWAHRGAAWDITALTPEGTLVWQLGPERLEGSVSAEPDWPAGGADGFGGPSWFAALRGFLDAARAGNPAAVRSPYRDAARSLALALAATEALRDGGWVVVQPV